MSKLSGEVLTLPKMSGSVLMPKSLNGNVGAKTINIGEDGATFIPSVSADGVISWTNDKELPNPDPVNIKGEAGYTPQKGVDYFDGKDGSDATVTAANIKSALNYTPANQEEVNNLSKDIDNLNENKQPKGDYALKSDIPNVPVQSVNGKTGAVSLSAQDVSADPAGTAETKVSEHNISTAAHNDIRLLIEGLTTRLNAIANSDDTTLDQMAEVVAYIKSNRTLIESITTGKVSVADIVNNLTTNVSNKPLSAAQGVVLKGLIDAIVVPTLLSQLGEDATHRTVTDTEKQIWNNKSNFSGNYNDLINKPTIPTKTSQLANDSGFLTSVPTEYVTETELAGKGYATQTSVNNLSKEKVNYTDIEEELNETSEKPVKNKTLFAKFKEIVTQITGITKEIGYFFGRKVTPEHYGAVGDGTTDDSVAIQQAINEAGSSKVVYLGKKNYKISTGLVLNTKYSTLKGEGTITYDGTGCAIKVTNSYVKLKVNRIDAPNGTAIQLNGEANEVNNCIVNVDMIRSSVKGLHLYTANKSMCYNNITIKEISASDIGVLVWVDRPNTDVNPYVNQNWYYLGRIYGCNVGIKLHSDALCETHKGFGTNDNVFLSGSFEGIADTGCSIYLDRTKGNRFENFRCNENYGANSIIFSGRCVNNEIQLSKIVLSEVDITGLASGSELNKLFGYLLTNASDGYSAGAEAMVDYVAGITYMPHNNVETWVTSSSFANNVITKKNMNIITSLNFNKTEYNGATFTLDPLYSEAYSIAKGYPLTVKFGNTSGRIILKDNLGGTILDNTDGYYANKSLSVRWIGYEKIEGKNIWSVVEAGARYVTEDALSNKGYLTSNDIANKVDNTETLTLTGIDADGNSHTWTIYGK